LWTINQDFGGLENMSLIPNVGTTRYKHRCIRAEIKDTFVSCTAISIAKQEIKSFSKEECHFGYRKVFLK
jgi:UDP-N-acetylmuramate dehydrogenase